MFMNCHVSCRSGLSGEWEFSTNEQQVHNMSMNVYGHNPHLIKESVDSVHRDGVNIFIVCAHVNTHLLSLSKHIAVSFLISLPNDTYQVVKKHN